jgi:DNA-binding NarL/FixJ family response regulator
MMNKKTANVLIVDDHPITIEGFERSLDYLAEQSQTLSFKTDRAEDCNAEYHKIKQYSLTQNLDLVILDLGLPAAPNLFLQPIFYA